MIESLSLLEFKFPWRSYQSHLLKNFENHISDNHFHVIAPPGSGKTILGIEIIRRLEKKALVLAPTITIRNQWAERMQSFFTKNNDYKLHSFDLKSPGDITFITYQSLYAFYKNFEKKDAYFSFFKEHGIEILVLDEAHHLKNAWWNSLITLKNNVPFYIVALTATPPYDSARSEVAKYFMLCGEIDDEIPVPDLVREKDLCPHHDFVYFSKPEDLEINFIVEYRRKIADLKDRLLKDETFVPLIKSHRFFRSPNFHLETLYANTEFFSAILIFLNACGIEIERSKLEVLGFHSKETIRFPKLTLNWLEILLQNLLVTDRNNLNDSEPFLVTLEKELRRLNVYEKRKVDLIGDDLLYKSLANSSSKLKSIPMIVSTERKSLGKDMRCVVLTDYIRKEFLSVNEDEINTINKAGVVPIFQYLKYFSSGRDEIAVLTGSLVIIHNAILEAFKSLGGSNSFLFKPLSNDREFLLVLPKKKTKTGIVNIMTTLFENGDIKILIGTKSLLGEGWDAPSINSLILASFVGSFVSSNQMRGRAIRKDPLKPKKTGNIWHLACLDPTAPDGGREVEILKRRFEAFVGVTNTSIPFVSNGFDRMGFDDHILVENVEEINANTLDRATKRSHIIDKWRRAIAQGTKMSKEVKIPNLGDLPYRKQIRIYYFDVIRFFVAELFFTMMLFNFEFILTGFNLVLQQGVVYFVYAFLAAFSATFGYKLFKAIKLYVKYGYLHKKIKKLGQVVLQTLYELDYMTSPKNSVWVASELVSKGDVVCSLEGGSLYENTLFSNSLSELLDPIKSPRYLIVKTSFLRIKLNVENFYPVPEIFGDKKENALVFQKHWRAVLGASKLFYTRHLDGRKLLLKARLFHMYNAFTKTSKEVTIWK